MSNVNNKSTVYGNCTLLGITATNKLINRNISTKYIARYQKTSRFVSRAI